MNPTIFPSLVFWLKICSIAVKVKTALRLIPQKTRDSVLTLILITQVYLPRQFKEKENNNRLNFEKETQIK